MKKKKSPPVQAEVEMQTSTTLSLVARTYLYGQACTCEPIYGMAIFEVCARCELIEWIGDVERRMKKDRVLLQILATHHDTLVALLESPDTAFPKAEQILRNAEREINQLIARIEEKQVSSGG